MDRLFKRFLKEDQSNEKNAQIPLTKLPREMREFVDSQRHELGRKHGRNVSFGAYVRWLIHKESLNNTQSKNEIKTTKIKPIEPGSNPPGTGEKPNRVRTDS